MLFAAVRADAATLTVTTDKSFYLPGETVTLTAVGNSGGATDYGLFASLTFNPAALLDPSSITFAPTTGTVETWIHGVLGCSTGEGPGHCWILNHIAFPPDPGLGMSPTEQTLATITATAGAPGLHSIVWSDAPGLEHHDGLTRTHKLESGGEPDYPGADHHHIGQRGLCKPRIGGGRGRSRPTAIGNAWQGHAAAHRTRRSTRREWVRRFA